MTRSPDSLILFPRNCVRYLVLTLAGLAVARRCQKLVIPRFSEVAPTSFISGNPVVHQKPINSRANRGKINSMPGESQGEMLRCSFCLRTQKQVRKLLSRAGTPPTRSYICDECVRELYAILMHDETGTSEPAAEPSFR